MMIIAGRGRSPETIAELGQERFSKSAQAWIANRSDGLPNEFEVGGLFLTLLRRPLEKFGFLLLGQWPHRPFSDVHSVLRSKKFTGDLDEILRLQVAARLKGGMIAPDA